MTLSRPGSAAASIAGAALCIDAILITIANSSVGAADDALWLIGLVGVVVASVIAAHDLGSARAPGVGRRLPAIALALGLIAVSGLALSALDAAGAHLSANRGVHDELGTFVVGLAWLLAGTTGRRRGRETLAAGLGTLLVALGIGSAGRSTPSASAAATRGAPVVSVAMPGTGLTLPASLPAGAVRVEATVAGRAPDRTLSFLRLDPGVSYAHALGAVARHHGDLDYLQGLGAIVLDAQMDRGRATATVSLTPGHYVALDTTAPSPAHWFIRPFTVAASAHPAPLPAPAATLSMIDFGFRGAARLREGELVRYVNDGFATHMALGLRVASAAAARRATTDLIAGRAGAAERLATTVYSFAGALSPGAVQEQPVTTPPGIYVLGCFMATQDGRDHTRLGMVRTITVIR
jgi:hypothetical protein